MHRHFLGLTISLLGFVLFIVLAWQVHEQDSPLWEFDRRFAGHMMGDADAHPARLGFVRGHPTPAAERC